MEPLIELKKTLDALSQGMLKPGFVSPMFQPIVDLTGVSHRVVAVEALARGPHGSVLEQPATLFLAARRAGLVTQLDRLCIASALEAARHLPLHLEIFLNVHPLTLSSDRNFAEFLVETAARTGIAPTRLVMEVLEHSRVDQASCRHLCAAVSFLRSHGVRFAVDDVNGAPDDIRRSLALRPDFVKVDAHVVRGAQRDAAMRDVLHAIAEQAMEQGARVIAEGIEELRDLSATSAAGITLAQGFLLSRPAPVEFYAHMLVVSA